jgi:uncharacterized RDD family membrane protein YckC
MNILTQAISTAIVSPIIECVDVDGVMRRVNVEEVLERIDMNALVDRIDINRILTERIDWNDLFQNHIDVNALVARVDLNEVLMRTDMGSIMKHSTTGMATEVLDALRSQVVVLDLWIGKGIKWCTCRRFNRLPPAYVNAERPVGESNDSGLQSDNADDPEALPRGRMRKALAVQGCYCNIVSKAIAMLIDVTFLTMSFAILIIIVDRCWAVLTGEQKGLEPFIGSGGKWAGAAYGVYWFLYFFLSVLLVGRTLGMGIVGLKVVVDQRSLSRATEHEDGVSFGRAFVRTLLLPFTSIAMPLLGVIGILRRDGRMLHDLVAGTGIVYKWDAHMAHLRERTDASKRMVATNPSESNLHTPLLRGDSQSTLRQREAENETPTAYATFSKASDGISFDDGVV